MKRFRAETGQTAHIPQDGHIMAFGIYLGFLFRIRTFQQTIALNLMEMNSFFVYTWCGSNVIHVRWL